MDEKIMNLLEKVYIELQDTKKELKNDINKLEIKIEHEVSDKVKILFEARDGVIERLDRIEDILHTISQKVTDHDVEIRVIKGGKKNS